MRRIYQLGDDEVAIPSINRQRRTAAEVFDTPLRNLPEVDPKAAKACASNLACGWSGCGVSEDDR